MFKIERKYLAHYLELPGGSFVRLGDHLEEYSPKLSARVEKTRNILGMTDVCVTGYEKTGTVEPFFARQGDPVFAFLQSILDGDTVMEGCMCAMVEVKLWDGSGSAHPAIREECCLEAESYGGDTRGYQIPFRIHYTGRKQAGTFDTAANTFTPA